VWARPTLAPITSAQLHLMVAIVFDEGEIQERSPAEIARKRAELERRLTRKVCGSPLAGGAIDSSRQRVRRTVHWLCSPRVSRSCHRAERRRSPHDPEIVRRLLHDVAYASLAREGLARTTTGDATGSRPSDRHSPSRRTSSPVQSSRCIDVPLGSIRRVLPVSAGTRRERRAAPDLIRGP
jgi:hypothetical protein